MAAYPEARAVRRPRCDEQRLAARKEDWQARERLVDVVLVDAGLVLRGAAEGMSEPHARGRWRERERTSQTVASSPVFSWCCRAHRSKALYFAPGASSSSRQLCERKHETSPSFAGSVLAASSSALVAAAA